MSTMQQLPLESPVASAPLASTRPFYWSVRRELWENRFVHVAPILVAAIVFFATTVSILTAPFRMRAGADAALAKVTTAVRAFHMAPAPIMFATFVVGLFYCLDALYGERRDRSILFWKSLPVSDRTTVLSKAAVPLVALPLIAFVLSVITQIVLTVSSTLILLGSGANPTGFLTELRFFQGLVIMIYGLGVHALWFSPVYAWFLLVSTWARRAPFLWAMLPLIVGVIIERIVFGTARVSAMVKYRLNGGMREAFTFEPGSMGNVDRLSQLEPLRFLSAPGLWSGLLFAAACLMLAIRLRRRREPI